MKQVLISLFILVTTGTILFFLVGKTSQSKPVLHLPEKDISLIIVDTPQTRAQGLSGRENLPQNTAMLFIFEDPDTHKFWMRDMKFPIDIIWLDEKFRIVHLAPNVSPTTFPTTFESLQNSLYVLEAVAGFSHENNLKIGDILNIDLKK